MSDPVIFTHSSEFAPISPDKKDVHLYDIAHGLARIQRYSGATSKTYSVAEHSCIMHDWILERGHGSYAAAVALLHDAAEVYSGFGDVARPVKSLAPIISEIEKNIWEKAVAPAFGIGPNMPDIVGAVDRAITVDEMGQGLGIQVDDVPLGVTLKFWTADRARYEFLKRAHALGLEANPNKETYDV